MFWSKLSEKFISSATVSPFSNRVDDANCNRSLYPLQQKSFSMAYQSSRLANNLLPLKFSHMSASPFLFSRSLNPWKTAVAASCTSQPLVREADLRPARSSPFTRAVVIGGGVAGLCTAYHLSRAGYMVTVIEASSAVIDVEVMQKRGIRELENEENQFVDPSDPVTGDHYHYSDFGLWSLLRGTWYWSSARSTCLQSRWIRWFYDKCVHLRFKLFSSPTDQTYDRVRSGGDFSDTFFIGAHPFSCAELGWESTVMFPSIIGSLRYPNIRVSPDGFCDPLFWVWRLARLRTRYKWWVDPSQKQRTIEGMLHFTAWSNQQFFDLIQRERLSLRIEKGYLHLLTSPATITAARNAIAYTPTTDTANLESSSNMEHIDSLLQNPAIHLDHFGSSHNAFCLQNAAQEKSCLLTEVGCCEQEPTLRHAKLVCFGAIYDPSSITVDYSSVLRQLKYLCEFRYNVQFLTNKKVSGFMRKPLEQQNHSERMTQRHETRIAGLLINESKSSEATKNGSASLPSQKETSTINTSAVAASQSSLNTLPVLDVQDDTVVVIAAGAGSLELCKGLGFALPAYSVKTVALLLQCSKLPTHSMSSRWWWWPWTADAYGSGKSDDPLPKKSLSDGLITISRSGDTLRVAGFREFVGPVARREKQPNEKLVRALWKRLALWYPRLTNELEHSLSLSPDHASAVDLRITTHSKLITADGAGILGRLNGISNCYLTVPSDTAPWTTALGLGALMTQVIAQDTATAEQSYRQPAMHDTPELNFASVLTPEGRVIKFFSCPSQR